jgi:hypothetical protein
MENYLFEIKNFEEFSFSFIKIIDNIPPFIYLFVHSLVIGIKFRDCKKKKYEITKK